jgi:hypothetical protein
MNAPVVVTPPAVVIPLNADMPQTVSIQINLTLTLSAAGVSITADSTVVSASSGTDV